MNVLSVILFLWFVALAIFTALMVYHGQLTRHETDELFLDDFADQLLRKEEHDLIIRKVTRIEPLCGRAGGATAVLTVAILGAAVVQALPYVRF